MEISIMYYRLSITPALEIGVREVQFEFATKAEMMAAHSACADLLLFLQDDMNVMDDYSNIFTEEQKVDGEWVDIED